MSADNSKLRDKHPRDFTRLSRRILHLANQKLMQTDFLHELSKVFLEYSGCSEVEICIKERTKYNVCRTRNSNLNTFSSDSVPLTSAQNQTPDDPASGGGLNGHDLTAVCHAFMTGDKSLNIFDQTKHRLFWTNDAPGSEINTEPNILSLLLLPISVNQEDIGLLVLKSEKADFFLKRNVLWYGEISELLGLAINQQLVQFELRERVKELSCLYNIARVAARPDLKLDEMLQGVVESMPPGWLYPEIAYGRIVFRKRSFMSAGLRRACHRQTAEILVNGEVCGLVEVVYTEEKPELDEGPFLKEERSLINAIARELSVIIERKLASLEKDRLREQLRHADRLATIGQLASGVAHELNEPLGSILGFAQLSQKCDNTPEQVIKDLEKIVNASLNARETIRKLLVFARQTPSRMVPVQLNKIIRECLELLAGRLVKEGITLELRLDENIPEIEADPPQLNQVLVNLIVNSMQAMPNGGELAIETTADENSVYLRVEDSGAGIDEDILKLIFVPFFTTKDVHEGTGLGLAVVHGIVISHGGSVKVESVKGWGSKFEIKLPVLNGS